MRRLPIWIAGLILLSLPAAAQRWAPSARTATMRPAPLVRTAPLSRPMFWGRAPGVRTFVPGRTLHVGPQWRHGFRSGHVGFGFGHYPFGVPPQNRCFSDAFFDPYFCTRRPTRFSSVAPYSYYPFYSVPYYYDDSSDNYSDVSSQDVERANARASDLASQVEQLRNELDQMRQQQSSPAAAPAPAPPPEQAAVQEPPVSTTLVFRDGHRSEVRNYAIVGSTLWIFHDQLRKKIPLAQLDLTATRQVNEDQGIDFPVPLA